MPEDAFAAIERREDAANSYSEVLRADPDFPCIKGLLLHQKMLCCDWLDFDSKVAEIDGDLQHGKLAAEPFGWQGVARSPRSLQLCARIYCEENFPGREGFSAHWGNSRGRAIRVGYLSGEFRDQATSHLIVGMLEAHDKSRFEIYGLDNGWDDNSEIRRRIKASLNELISIRLMDDASVVKLIADKSIDILVNLNGYFGENRMNVFARKPSSVQVNYLGFPGTLGASYIDYIVADERVIYQEDTGFYDEKVVFLPHSYQPNDRRKLASMSTGSWAEHGLPADSFVFCCFNATYKIVPDQFDCWMRLLRAVENSVLWLIEDNPVSVKNLKVEAERRGVTADRLVFAKRVRLDRHLARHRLAALFVQTLPYNAHTTASDSLWAGVPVLYAIR